MLNFVHMIDIQGREPYFWDFVKDMLEIWVRLDIYELISFKHDTKTDMPKLYILILE